MSCNGQGICGCGRKRRVVNAWWFHFCGLWWPIAFEMTERAGHRRSHGFIQWCDEQDTAA